MLVHVICLVISSIGSSISFFSRTHLLFSLMETIDISITKQVVVSSPAAKSLPWVMVGTSLLNGIEFVELKKGDKGFTQWITGKKAFDTKVSKLIDEVIEIQHTASLTSMSGGDHTQSKSKFIHAKQMTAFKQLAERSSVSTVQVLLPAFDYEGKYVPEVETVMPLQFQPKIPKVPIKEDVLKWLFLRYKYIDAPEPRHADHAPLEKDTYWHKQKNKFVATLREGDAEKKYKVLNPKPSNSVASSSVAEEQEQQPIDNETLDSDNPFRRLLNALSDA